MVCWRIFFFFLKFLKGNFEKVSVFTRKKSKAESLIKLGAEFKKSPKEVAEESDIVISIVGYPKDVSQVLFS